MSAREGTATEAGTRPWHASLPSGWRANRLGQLATKIGSGKTPSGGAASYVDDGVMFLRSQNVHDDGLRLDDVVQIPHAVDESMRETRVRHGDILLNITGASLGRTCIVPSSTPPANVNQHVAIVRMRDTSLRPFLSWALKSHGVQVQIQATQNGAAREGLNFVQIAQLTVPIPPDAEGAAIAAFLERETAKIDALVAEQQRLMALLKEKRQAVISHAVTKGLNPDAPMKASGVEWLGDVPAHWRVERIAHLFHEIAEAGLDDLPILSVSIHTGVSSDELDDEEMDRKVTRSDDRTKYKQVARGDLVYNMMRAWQGGFGTVTVAGMVSPAYVVARPFTLGDTNFVEHLLRTPQAIEQMRRHSKGVTDFRLRLYWDEFRNIRVPVPPKTEMDSICARIAALSDEFAAMTSACEDAVALLSQRRAALISAAVTGQIDVRHLATADAA